MSPTNGVPKGRQSSKNAGGLLQERETHKNPKSASQREKAEDLPSKDVNDDVEPNSKDLPSKDPQTFNDTASWLNWFSRAEQAKHGDKLPAKHSMEQEERGESAKDRPQSTVLDVLQDGPTLPTKQRRSSDPNPASPKLQQEPPPRSWLGLWGNATTQTTSSSAASATGIATNIAEGLDASKSSNKISDEAKSDAVATPRPHPQPEATVKSYGWAFWSRDQSKDYDGKATSGKNMGELALADSPSQSKPENAFVDEARSVPSRIAKRQRPQSLDVSGSTKASRNTDESVEMDVKPEVAPVASKVKPVADPGSQAKRMPENLLLPSFRRTYNAVGRPNIIQQLGRLLQLSPPVDKKHVDIVSSPPQIKRALAIVSIPEATMHDICYVTNASSLGCPRLLSCSVNTLSSRPTNRNFDSLY